MAAKKTTTKKTVNTVKKNTPDYGRVETIQSIADSIGMINVGEDAMSEKLSVDLLKVVDRMNTIASTLKKKIDYAETAAEREAKKAERDAAKLKRKVLAKKRIEEKMQALQAKLDAMNE